VIIKKGDLDIKRFGKDTIVPCSQTTAAICAKRNEDAQPASIPKQFAKEHIIPAWAFGSGSYLGGGIATTDPAARVAAAADASRAVAPTSKRARVRVHTAEQQSTSNNAVIPSTNNMTLSYSLPQAAMPFPAPVPTVAMPPPAVEISTINQEHSTRVCSRISDRSYVNHGRIWSSLQQLLQHIDTNVRLRKDVDIMREVNWLGII
jgi:hypothetical protein